MVEAVEQLLDQPGLGQLLAEQPKLRNAVLDREPQKARERQPVRALDIPPARPTDGDPLEAIDRLVRWESFRADIEAVVLTPGELKKSSAGRKPFDAILMFRILVLQ